MSSKIEKAKLLESAKSYLDRLSPQRLETAIDFLAYLEQKDEEAATQELLSIPNFESELLSAEAEAEAGQVVSWKDIRRDV